MPKIKSNMKYAALIVPVIAFIAMAALFGKIGVRPRALSVIKATAFDDLTDLGFWTSRQTRQKLFRNQLVFFGWQPTDLQSLKIIEGFLIASQKDGPAYDVIVGPENVGKGLPNTLHLKLPKGDAAKLIEFIRPYLLAGKRVIAILETPQTSKLFKKSISRQMEFEQGQKVATFTTLRQTQSDLDSLLQSDFCDEADKLSFDNADTLRCLFLPQAKKFNSEIEKTGKPQIGAVDQFGLDDYLIYLYSR